MLLIAFGICAFCLGRYKGHKKKVMTTKVIRTWKREEGPEETQQVGQSTVDVEDNSVITTSKHEKECKTGVEIDVTNTPLGQLSYRSVVCQQTLQSTMTY